MVVYRGNGAISGLDRSTLPVRAGSHGLNLTRESQLSRVETGYIQIQKKRVLFFQKGR